MGSSRGHDHHRGRAGEHGRRRHPFTVTVIDKDTFSLDNRKGNGNYTSGGTWTFPYMLVASGTDADDKPISATSAQFNINPPLSLTYKGQTVDPQLKFVERPGRAAYPRRNHFLTSCRVYDANKVPNLPANFFSTGQAPPHVTIILVQDSAGNPLPTGPFMQGDGFVSVLVGNNGLITFHEAIDVPTNTSFQMWAVLDLGSVTITNKTTPTAPTITIEGDSSDQSTDEEETQTIPDSTVDPIVPEGMGTINTTNFDTITNNPVTQALQPPGKTAVPTGRFVRSHRSFYAGSTTAECVSQLSPGPAAGNRQVLVESHVPTQPGGFTLPTDSLGQRALAALCRPARSPGQFQFPANNRSESVCRLGHLLPHQPDRHARSAIF